MIIAILWLYLFGIGIQFSLFSYGYERFYIENPEDFKRDLEKHGISLNKFKFGLSIGLLVRSIIWPWDLLIYIIRSLKY